MGPEGIRLAISETMKLLTILALIFFSWTSHAQQFSQSLLLRDGGRFVDLGIEGPTYYHGDQLKLLGTCRHVHGCRVLPVYIDSNSKGYMSAEPFVVPSGESYEMQSPLNDTAGGETWFYLVEKKPGAFKEYAGRYIDLVLKLNLVDKTDSSCGCFEIQLDEDIANDFEVPDASRMWFRHDKEVRPYGRHDRTRT